LVPSSNVPDPVYELYDTERHLSYSVKEIPTPERAATLIEKPGEPLDYTE
jgi:hypothetical protein